MRQLFGRRSNAISKAILIGLAGSVGGAGVLALAIKWSPWDTDVGVAITQPVPFSHQHHVGGLGLDCRYCHSSVETSAAAGYPPTHTCMTCHSQIWTNAKMLQPVRDSYAQGKPLEWRRVYDIPKFAFFNHSIHVNKGVGCTSCHGAVDRMPLLWKAKPFFMRDCLACHRHPEEHLRPQSQIFAPDWIAPPDQKEIGARLIRENRIPTRRLTDCVTCHR